MSRRLLAVAAGVAAAWFATLVLLDAALIERQIRHVRDRLAESLRGTADIGDGDLALVRGKLTLDRVSVTRDDGAGHLALSVREVSCGLSPIGWGLIDHRCGELAVRGARLEVSTAALFKLPRPKHEPITARDVTIDDAVLEFSPSAIVPTIGRIEIAIDHARSGVTVLRTPLSWILTIEDLHARIALPGMSALKLTYRDGRLRVAGSLLGSDAVELAVTLPDAAGVRDAHGEIELLVAFGTEVAKRVAAKRVEDWLRARLN